MTNSINIIGLMSGTSVDGLDICYVSFDNNDPSKYEIIDCETIDYDDNLKTKLKNVIEMDNDQIKQIDKEFGEFIGLNVLKFIKKNTLYKADLISSHGHTVFHEPKFNKTLQIGNGEIINKVTKIKTVNNFREQDIQLGGQGAPLVPIGDKLLFDNYKYCLNLGGFTNISVKDSRTIYAYDICPLNTVLNHYANKLGYDCDLDGKLSEKGVINIDLLNELNDLEYYKKSYPKSLGLEFVIENIFPITEKYKIKEVDILATYIEHASFQIKRNIDNGSKVLLTGGGTFNDNLIKTLNHDSKINFIVPDKTIINYKESLIFALLGYLKINGKVNCLRSVTGASNDHSSGDIYG
tara:strand:- start:3585 stop:4637 length:1053 start_codon:yes stop_codon:yes gene_type:complete